jgi:hypothetical protein
MLQHWTSLQERRERRAYRGSHPLSRKTICASRIQWKRRTRLASRRRIFARVFAARRRQRPNLCRGADNEHAKARLNDGATIFDAALDAGLSGPRSMIWTLKVEAMTSATTPRAARD